MAVGDKTPIKWKDADFKWNAAPPSKDYKVGFKPSSFPYTWNDVALVEEAIGAGGGGVMGAGGNDLAIRSNNPMNEFKKRRKTN